MKKHTLSCKGCKFYRNVSNVPTRCSVLHDLQTYKPTLHHSLVLNLRVRAPANEKAALEVQVSALTVRVGCHFNFVSYSRNFHH